MERLLSCISMMKSLSLPEYKSFIKQLTSNKETFTYLVFNLSINSLPDRLDDHPINLIHKLLTNILQKRKLKQKMTEKNNSNFVIAQRTIDKLPHDLIRKITSFLTLNKICKIERCNKSLFIAARSPSNLQKINNLKAITKYNENIYHLNYYSFQRFKNISELHISCNHLFTMNKLIKYSVYKTVETLHLYDCNYLNRCNQYLIFFSNIQKLYLNGINWEIQGYAWDLNYFDLLLISFFQSNNLEFLGIQFENFADHHLLSTHILSILKPINFRGLSFHYGTPFLHHTFLSHFSNKLESFHFSENDGIFEYLREFGDPIQYKFSNLKELCLGGNVDSNEFDVFNIGCNKLEKINIKCSYNRNFVGDSLIRLLSRPSINYVSIFDDDTSFSALQKALEISKRETIIIQITPLYRMDANSLEMEIQKCLQQLNANVEKDWMLIVDFVLSSNFINYHDWINKLKQKYVVNTNTKQLIIENIECKINGYQQKWLMKCENCQCL